MGMLGVDKRFLSTYYIVNWIYLLSYFLVRPLLFPLDDTDADASNTEYQVFWILCLLVFLKAFKCSTWDGVFFNFFLFGKVAFLVLTFKYHKLLFIAYSILALILFIILRQPIYSGPQDVRMFNVASLETEAMKDKNRDWIIEFYTTWVPSCNDFAPLLAELSLKYTTPTLKFGKVDVGRYPKVAEKYHIDTSGSTWQLPTLIRFSKGEEVARLPQVSASGAVEKVNLTKDVVVNFFELKKLGKKPESKKQAEESRKAK